MHGGVDKRHEGLARAQFEDFRWLRLLRQMLHHKAAGPVSLVNGHIAKNWVVHVPKTLFRRIIFVNVRTV